MNRISHAERLGVRLSAENKGLIAQAADLLGLNVSAFTVSTLVEKAQAVVDRRAVVTMSNKDRDRFLSLLDNPPKPTAALRRAAKRHRETVVR